ncbi:MAG: glycosyltransferase [Saprospiraceae bacterium]
MNEPKKVLVAPLNWGLGHATRCIPIIRFLQKQNASVFLASDGRAFHLLKKEFPELPIFQLPAYNITYRTSNMMWDMAWQFPKMMRAIAHEKKGISKIVEKEKIDIIISDNRFGVFSQKTYNVFMTHQINLPIPIPLFRQIGNWLNRKMIQRFDECWIPDFEKKPNLSGKLSHGNFKLNNTTITKYIGSLSRIKKIESNIKRKAIIILSGPEPQRTFLEKKILDQALKLPFQFLLVKGQTEKQEHFYFNKNIEIVSFLTSEKLNQTIAESEIVISRSGYTTLMDLVALEKKAILIPTPGQTEQEYLARHFFEQKIFFSTSQKDFDLKNALEEVESFSGFEKSFFENSIFEKNVIEMLEKE